MSWDKVVHLLSQFPVVEGPEVPRGVVDIRLPCVSGRVMAIEAKKIEFNLHHILHHQYSQLVVN